MAPNDLEQIRQLVRYEVENVVRSHLVSLTEACIAPMMDVLGEVLRNQKLLSDGQVLVERSLLDRPDDGEEWRQSLEEPDE